MIPKWISFRAAADSVKSPPVGSMGSLMKIKGWLPFVTHCSRVQCITNEIVRLMHLGQVDLDKRIFFFKRNSCTLCDLFKNWDRFFIASIFKLIRHFLIHICRVKTIDCEVRLGHDEKSEINCPYLPLKNPVMWTRENPVYKQCYFLCSPNSCHECEVWHLDEEGQFVCERASLSPRWN